MKKKVIKRAVMCVYCGRKWDYVEGNDPHDLWALAIEHEKVCPNNPLVARINLLSCALKVVAAAPKNMHAEDIASFAKDMLAYSEEGSRTLINCTAGDVPFTMDKEPVLDTSKKQAKKATKALNKIAKKGRKEIEAISKSSKHKCLRCGTTDDVSFGPDPYGSDIHGDDSQMGWQDSGANC